GYKAITLCVLSSTPDSIEFYRRIGYHAMDLDELKDQKNAKKIIGLMETVIGTVCPDPAQYAIIYNSIATIPLKRFTGISLGALSDATIDGFVHYFNTGSVADMLKVISFGIPDTALNLIDPLARKIADKMSTK
ncbi:MAG: hypothetical protein IK036_01580, partial [Clostridia bacterium]|nr:hypothetical protein [Clostridia bacterium]